MASSEVIGCHLLDHWYELLRECKQSNNLVVVDFTASWCGPCRFMAPILADMARKMPHVSFIKVDVDELKSVAEDWAVEAMPTFVFMKEGKIVDRVVGAVKDELQLKVAQHSAPVTATATATA